jgi:hypothetical protein
MASILIGAGTVVAVLKIWFRRTVVAGALATAAEPGVGVALRG